MYISEATDIQSSRRISTTALEKFLTPNLKRLIKMIEYYDFKIRIVGGAVRDLLLGIPPRDIDLLTDALPDQIIYILENNGLHAYTKGIPHGTIKVKYSDNEEYEITSIAFAIDQECCPPHLITNNGGSWQQDAQRRDFTIDTMSLSFDGLLYDYMNGIEDLRKQYVRFIGSPAERIQKEPILIMRFFRLLSMFRDPKFDKAILPILKDKMKLVKKIKPARMQREMSNIHRGQNAARVFKMMKNLFPEIDKYISNLDGDC